MKSIIKNAKSVDEAIEAALEELGVTREAVTVEILEEGKKGFLGLAGKDASVCVRLKNSEETEESSVVDAGSGADSAARAEMFLQPILEAMKLDAKLSVKTNEEEKSVSIDISGEDMGILIGRRGETLSALQYLTSLAVNRHQEEYCRIILDTENYKKRREETLKRLAKKLAGSAVRYRRNVTLEAMSPYERRIIHSVLQDDPMVSTYSTGEEPNRKVVIVYKGGKH